VTHKSSKKCGDPWISPFLPILSGQGRLLARCLVDTRGGGDQGSDPLGRSWKVSKTPPNPSPVAHRGTDPEPVSGARLPEPVFHDKKHGIKIYQGDCLEILAGIPESCIDLIFADPPYFLSNNGITCHAGRMVSVNKGEWDRSRGPDANHEYNRAWLSACQRVLKPNGTIWVSGTSHVNHSVGFAMQQLGFKLLNDITWVKPNPPPNLSCRYFTHATETIVWAARSSKSKHLFHYDLMRKLAGGKQMKSVWTIPPPEPWEKRFGKHPTQKPVALLERILLASSNEGDLVLDPFMGSGTTLLTAFRLHRRALGCELSLDWLDVSIRRICSDLVQVQVSVCSIDLSLDLVADPMDRSIHRTSANMPLTPQLRLVRQERVFYFVGAFQREVIYSARAESMEQAWEKFHTSPKADLEVFCVIHTETEIYLAG
jgi:site-specific DNA-methyltransferase (adenine-specific)